MIIIIIAIFLLSVQIGLVLESGGVLLSCQVLAMWHTRVAVAARGEAGGGGGRGGGRGAMLLLLAVGTVQLVVVAEDLRQSQAHYP